METMSSLGIVTDKDIPEKENVEELFDSLENAFEKDDVTKEEIVKIIKGYLPNFGHIETGKSLDIKMYTIINSQF